MGYFISQTCLVIFFGSPITSAIINRWGTPNHIHGIIWSGLLMAVGGLFCLVLRIQKPVDTLSLKFNFGLLHQKRKGGYTKKIELFF